MFMAWRIRIIIKSNWIALSIVFFALVGLAGGCWTGATVIIVKRFSKKPRLHWPALMWLLASAVSDAIITCTLVFSLSRRKTGFNSTDDAINRIIRMTVQTGLITAIFAALDVISFMAIGETTLYVTWSSGSEFRLTRPTMIGTSSGILRFQSCTRTRFCQR
ncbi:hypothetical protein HGRIS_009125 [Hohenbuehelia grisea]|uniref:DUF6534 domain-containing protein n=1 Tax=Hohenbuehelia grisea TaxID=104357 RepID=A0ABR3J1K9_9AGAR